MVLSAYYPEEATVCNQCGEEIPINDERTHMCSNYDLPPVPRKNGYYDRDYDRDFHDGKMENITRGFNAFDMEDNSRGYDDMYGNGGKAGRPKYESEWFEDDSSPLPPKKNIYDSSRDRERKHNSFLQNIPLCLNCSKPVYDNEDGFEVEILGGWFHSDCFTCEICRQPFSEELPFVPKDGRAYCEPHYEDNFLPKCAAWYHIFDVA
jgi:hypothetical protein